MWSRISSGSCNKELAVSMLVVKDAEVSLVCVESVTEQRLY